MHYLCHNSLLMTEITDDSWENTQKTHMNTAIKYDCKNDIFHKIKNTCWRVGLTSLKAENRRNKRNYETK